MLTNRFVVFHVKLAFACVLAAGSVASAQMTLTPQGTARNFTLSTFATGFASSGGIGPIPIDFQNDGSILVGTYVDNRIYRFTNTDNQTVASTPFLTGYPNAELAHGIAHWGDRLFVSHYNSQTIDELNPDGSVNHTVAGGLGNARALLANPANGHLFTSTVQGVRDVNPNTGIFTTLTTQELDGITISPDGSTLYGAAISGGAFGHLLGYNTTTGAVVFDSGFVPGGLDGTALGFGQRTGFIYGNLNNGNVVEINLSTLEQVTIATGGSRGDFVSSDPSGSGDLLLTQTDRIIRLSGIPTPGAAALLGVAGLFASRRRRSSGVVA
ncbi:MAG: hypothetical protein GC200_08960 [Tepidisphaera sp.]|nr:hypothetical protein [Tepidisphaera sp.]